MLHVLSIECFVSCLEKGSCPVFRILCPVYGMLHTSILQNASCKNYRFHVKSTENFTSNQLNVLSPHVKCLQNASCQVFTESFMSNIYRMLYVKCLQNASCQVSTQCFMSNVYRMLCVLSTECVISCLQNASCPVFGMLCVLSTKCFMPCIQNASCPVLNTEYLVLSKHQCCYHDNGQLQAFGSHHVINVMLHPVELCILDCLNPF